MLKLTIKLTLIISLFCSVVIAGDQGEGGFTEGDQGEGGAKCTECVKENQKESKDHWLIFIEDYLNKILG